MLRKLQQLREQEKGFTIIEVLIVLAIGALILVIVLIAIPQLQRNQRNTARKSVLSRMVTEVGNFSGNNNGAIPAPDTDNDADNNIGSPADMGSTAPTSKGFSNRYLGCTATTAGAGPSAVTTVTCKTNVTEPKSGKPVDITVATKLASGTGTAPTNDGEVGYYQNAKCNGETIEYDSNDRLYAFAVKLEGGAIYCLSPNS